MAQEFTIKSPQIEDKINQLLPSQGGFQAGVDFSASTMVVPIVDLTESAEGSSLRADLQSAISHDTMTTFSIQGVSTSTIVNTTGYWRVFGVCNIRTNSSDPVRGALQINDGTTVKKLIEFDTITVDSDLDQAFPQFDFIIKLAAGDSLEGTCDNGFAFLKGCVRQLADVNGNLVNP